MAINVSGGGAAGGTPAPTLSTTNAAGSAGTFLRTDDQLAIFDATVPVTQASADVAAAGTAAIAARRDHKHGMPTISSGALTRAGGNTTEATTTSTTVVDILTVSSLSITAGTPFQYLGAFRKSLGAAAQSQFRLKINTTVVSGPFGVLSGSNAAESFVLVGFGIANLTNYLSAVAYTIEGTGNNPLLQGLEIADVPAATITDIVFGGFSGNGAVTTAVDDVHVYTFATS